MRGVIRLQDPTSHGGKVVGAAPNSTVLGVAVARAMPASFLYADMSTA